MSKDLRLTQASTEMFIELKEEMKNYDFDSINLPLLLYGLIDSSSEDEENNPLRDYIFNASDIVAPMDIEDLISVMITDYCMELQCKLEEEAKQAEKHSGEEEGETEGSSDKKEDVDGAESVKEKKKQSDFADNWTFEDYEGNEMVVPANADVVDVFEQLVGIMVQQETESEVTILHFIIAVMKTNNRLLKKFFEKFNISYKAAKSYFEKIELGKTIPFELASFISVLNEKIDTSKPCEILMRDAEVDNLWNIMLKKNKRNSVVVGEAGVGKTAIVEKITYDIVSGNCPKQFEGFRVINLDVNVLIAGTKYRGDSEERIKNLIEFLEKNNDIILFIDEVHTILGAGSCFEGEMDLANALKPILARGDTIVIGATTQEEYEKYFQKDAALSRRFEKVKVDEPMNKDVYPMIKNKVKALSSFHGVEISKAIVEYATMIASCFAFEKKNPDKTLDLIDRAMVTAKRKGRKEVSKACVLKNFAIFFKMWENMSDDSKKEVAYHEAGHYIVGKASGRLITHNWLAISIMPAEDYLGVTVWEDDKEKVAFYDISYFVDEIAFSLGGRVAENIFRGSYTSGASQDLDSATKRAFQVITKFGMLNGTCKNRIFLNAAEYPMFSEKATDTINQEVNELIDKAFKRAKQLIYENKDILAAIVDALLENYIMSEKELDKIWRDTVKKRNE